MGVKGLYEFLKKYANKCMSTCILDELKKGPVALDANLFLYKLMAFHGKEVTKLTRGLGKTLEKLKAVGLVPVLVFDGPMHVPEKKKTGEIRKKRKLESVERIEIVKEKMNLALKLKEDQQDPLSVTSPDDTTNKDADKPYDKSDEKWLTKIIKEDTYIKSIHSLEQQSRTIDQATSVEIQAKLEEQGYMCIRSESEGDFVMAHLARANLVNYVFSDDGDLFVFGTPILVRNLTAHLFDSSKPLNVYKLPDILKQLKLTMDQFIDVCILSKTDYTPHGILNHGACKAYKAILKFKTIENFLKKNPKLKYEETFPEEAKLASALFHNPRSEDFLMSFVPKSHEIVDTVHVCKLIAAYYK